MGSLFLLQGIFPTQGSNPGLPHRRQILYPLSRNFHFHFLTNALSYTELYLNIFPQLFLLLPLVSVGEIVLLFKTNLFICVHDLEPLIIYFLCIFSILLSMATFPSVCKYHCLCRPLPCIISNFSLKISVSLLSSLCLLPFSQ